MNNQRAPKIDAASAEQLGRMACREGRVRAPIADPTYKNELLPKYLGADEMEPKVTAARRELAHSFLRGFDRENLATS
jgi:hypothetical protein